MRWLSIFRQRRHPRWMPVTNADDDTTGMDDLMRMAMEDSCDEADHQPDLGSTGEDSSLLLDGNHHSRTFTNSLPASDFEGPVFCHEAPLESFSSGRSQSISSPHSLHQPPIPPSSNITNSSPTPSSSPNHYQSSSNESENSTCGRRLLCGSSCFCKLPKATFPKSRPCLVVLSVLVPLLCMGLCAGLGVYSLLVYKTDKLVIDKSVKSFSIPNHKVYKDFEAMMLARRDNSSSGRYKRDVSSSPGSLTQRHSSDFDKFLSRSKRQAILEKKESEKLQETEEILRKLNLVGSGFTRSDRQMDSFTSSSGSSGLLSDGIHRVKRSQEINCFFQSVPRWKMHVIYLAQGDDNHNMFTKERLETVHNIEHQIMRHPGFHDFCLRDLSVEHYDPAVRDMHGCVPLNSLMTYFYPSKDTQGHIFYDGMGSNIDDIDSALDLAMNHETFYYYVDDKINKTFKKSHLLRSEVLFGAPLPGYSCFSGGLDHSAQDEKLKDFVITYIDLLSAVSTDKVHVLYGGKEIFDYEVTTTFWSDIRLAIISLIAIFALMLVLTLSLYLTILGIIIIGLSFPISLFFYRVVFEINALGILTGAAVFVIIGIGVDDVFVFVNIYRQAAHMSNPLSRIKYTVKTAGVATFFTSFTTAAAFAANLASSIPAVYQFGLFMALIVSSCWVSVFIMMPPLLYFHACCVEPLEMLLFSCFPCGKKVIGGRANSSDSGSMSPVMQDEVGLYHEDDDVPMLDVQGETHCSDDQLLSVNEDSLSDHQTQASIHQRITRNNNNMCLGRVIQKFVMFLTNRIILPGRYVVIGCFVLLLAISCFLMSQLQPATHPPQLFRPDTNLQMLLDLKANFSIIDTLHCDRCSALYKVPPSATHASRKWPKPTEHVPDLIPPPPTPASHEKLADRVSDDMASSKTETADLSPSSQHSNSSKFLEHSLSALADGTSSTPLKLILYGLAHLYSSALSLNVTEGNETGSIGHHEEPISHSITPSPRPTSSVPPHNRRAHMENPRPDIHNKSNKGDSHRDHQEWFKSQSGGSLAENFNVCKDQRCNNLKDRPLMESGTTVYVVFGISGVDRSNEDVGHVMDLFKGKALFDVSFANAFNVKNLNVDNVRELCRVCHILSNMTELVKEGSAQCLPVASSMYQLRHFLSTIDECRDLPSSLSIYQHQAPAHAEGGIDHKGRLLWLAFAFESTTKEGLAYSKAYKEYLKWEEVIQHIKDDVLAPDSPLRSIFQTSEFWTKVMMEVVAVNSAIYGLALSMVICIISVAVFTGHLVLLVIVVVTIMVMICCVVGIFFLAGWEMGAVEAVSLSILVGSSVDYCVHIVEGYVLAGRRMDATELKTQSAKDLRKLRTSQAVRHIGVAIVCSGLTTIIAAVPLTQTFIQPFTKFGSILLINTSVSMLLTLTLATALLATFAPARFRGTFRSHLIAFVLVILMTGLTVLLLYVLTKCGVLIPGPSGATLFS